MKVAKSFLSEIIWMDMDPISRKMKMKKVAGFHPRCAVGFLPGPVEERERRGLGTSDLQKDASATELTWRHRKASSSGFAEMKGRRSVGARSVRRSTAEFMLSKLSPGIKKAVVERMRGTR
jgi:hypothetical protein